MSNYKPQEFAEIIEGDEEIAKELQDRDKPNT